ncbi:MAG: PilZ domain-containing protein [Alphaproteobacteria bacterium]
MLERLKDISRHALARITGQSEANDDDRRRSERVETLIFGTVMSGGEMVPVRVLDLSSGGARIELPEAQAIRDLVWLHWPRLERLGRVMWGHIISRTALADPARRLFGRPRRPRRLGAHPPAHDRRQRLHAGL